MSAMPLLIGVLACLAIAYRFYSAFLAAKVAVLDDTRVTPALRLDDGQNYHPTNKWVLFGHHFAAISGAGPLIGPVLAIQFGYLPGLIWIVIGVCLAGAVQDMLVLAASVRHNGRSLAEIARAEIGSVAGVTASISILFVVVIALSGLGLVVVKALGGEEVKFAKGTILELPESASDSLAAVDASGRKLYTLPGDTLIRFPNGAISKRSESFAMSFPPETAAEIKPLPNTEGQQRPSITLPDGVLQTVPGSSWGTFTIACTVPIALFIGLYMYKFRKGKVVEASAIGAIAVLAATVAGNWIPNSPLEPYFSLSRGGIIWAICIYGFVASVLPVWMLLCPRDYLSSFLKIGTVVLLVGAVIVANPTLKAPAVNDVFRNGGGPYFNGALFPFCFICIMCGAISGFHALVSSGTTPKMIGRESDIRTIGYGAMLIEGLVAVVALLAAASLSPGNYYAINIDLAKVEKYADKLQQLDALHDTLPEIERQVGGESLRGRTGGAVTLAVGMSEVFTQASNNLGIAPGRLESIYRYWYHFAIMFEALFILTTIDTGTRIARFLLQEVLGKIYKPLDRADWMPGAIFSTALVTLCWGSLIWSGSIETIWPMFGIANQMLAVIALAVVTTVMINAGRGRYAYITVLPMLFVLTTTITAAYQMITGWSYGKLQPVFDHKAPCDFAFYQALLNIALTIFIVASVLIIVVQALTRWLSHYYGLRGAPPGATAANQTKR